MNRLLCILFAVMLAACGNMNESTDGRKEPTFHADQDPLFLSEWGQLAAAEGRLKLSDRVYPYDLNTPLFTDYAHKLRTIWVPKGAQMGRFKEDGTPDLAVGTVIAKTFYYPLADNGTAKELKPTVLKALDRAGQFSPYLGSLDGVLLLETRLLVRRDEGWVALSYIWDGDQKDARLSKIGGVKGLSLQESASSSVDFAYVIPNKNQCAGCHAPNATTKELQPLGFRPRHLNKAFTHGGESENQLDRFEKAGVITRDVPFAAIPANANWADETAPIGLRARSYLDINCSHCHNPKGPADTSGLDLTVNAPLAQGYGVCKLPIAAGAGTGGRSHDIVPGDPDTSILVYRMETTDPGAMMPELGRSLAHKEGVALIRDWIEGLKGECPQARQVFSR